MRRMVVVLTAGAMALAACGGDDDDAGGGGDVSEEEQPYVDAIAAQFTTGDDGELNMSDEQANCVAPRWLDTIGLDTLQAQDITPEDIEDNSVDELPELGLDEAQGNELYDAFGACDVDVPALLTQSIASGEDLDDETVACIEDSLDEDLVRRIMVGVVTEGDEALAGELGTDLQAALIDCVPS